MESTKTSCDVAAEVGAKVLVIHSLKPARDVPEDWDEIMRGMLAEIAEHVLPLPVILGIENLNWLVVPSEDLALVRSQSPAATGFVLDTGHADLFDATNEYLALSGPRLCGVHLQDTDGTRDRHWLPGRGRLDWKGFIQRLVQTGYTGPLTLEVAPHEQQDDLPGYLHDAMAAARTLQEYLPEELRPKGEDQ